MNDYAGQRELIAENMMISICVELTKYLQDLKQERKTVRKGGQAGREGEWGLADSRMMLYTVFFPQHLSDAKKAQQNLESSFKHLESVSYSLLHVL